ncbi:MAG: RHS repeat-associated core domain-containing protein, partial [Gemmatimonadota bacterium]
ENTNLPGLSFFRNRFYDQNTGRWLQEDPLGLAAGTNLYQYVGNNPASYTDPFGLCKPWPECMFQAWANSGAQRGGLLGSLQLNGAAALSAASEAFGTNDLGEAVGSGDALGIGLAGVGFVPAGRGGRLVKEFLDHPSAFKRVGAVVEASTKKGNRGGASIQTIFENANGDQVIEHTLVDRAGRVIGEPHPRAYIKPRAGDVD